MNHFDGRILNAKIFLNELIANCKNFEESKIKEYLFKIRKCKKIVTLLSEIKNSIIRGGCDEKYIREGIIKMCNIIGLNLEIFWYFLKSEILSCNDFLFIFDMEFSANIQEYLSVKLFKNIFIEQEYISKFKNQMNSDFFDLLLIHKEKYDLNGRESPAYKNFINALSKYVNSGNNCILMSTNLFFDGFIESSFKNPIIKLFLFDFIDILLSDKSESYQEIFLKNEHFLNNEKLLWKKSLKIFDLINSTEIMEFLKDLLMEKLKLLHWKNFFVLVTCMTHYYEHADLFKKMKLLIQFFLEKALHNSCEYSLLFVFIMARHCAFAQTSYFPNYSQWFSLTFSTDSSRPINTEDKAIFFINFLSCMVQYDSAYYLKVHINRVPYLPLNCQSLLSDYVKLVKTRLFDLNESNELGLYDNGTFKTSAEFDVETVINIFKNTCEIPKCVLEASLFCKSYYEKKFLCTLLSKFEGQNSVRHKLISKLHSLGKIPNATFKDYEKKHLN